MSFCSRPASFRDLIIGWVPKPINLCGRYTPTHAPTPIAYGELIIRSRSSDRCSKNVIGPPLSSSRAAMELSGWLLLVMGGGRVARAALALRFCGQGFRGWGHPFAVRRV